MSESILSDPPKTLEERLSLDIIANPNNVILERPRFKDRQGKSWRLARTHKDEWVRVREYEFASQEDCEEEGPHVIYPKQERIPGRVTIVQGLRVETEESEMYPCDLCGTNVVITNSMVDNPDVYPQVKIVLPDPKPAKKGVA